MKPEPAPIGEPFTWRNRVSLTWVKGPLWDHASALLIVAWLGLSLLLDFPILLTETEKDARRAIFQTLAAVSGTTAGLTLTSVSIMTNLMRTPLGNLHQFFKSNEKRRIGEVFVVVLPKLLVTFILSLATLAIESHDSVGTWWVEGLTLWFALASISGIARVVWVLRRLLAMS